MEKQTTTLKTAQKIHLIGIGGIGVSAIARMLILEGKKVSGSDRSRSEITDELEKMGATFFVNQAAEHIAPDTDLVIYTVAIPPENPELVKAHELGITTITYPQALHEISKEKFTIAVSGTHGKTTTTAMIAKILMDAEMAPTVIVGSLLKDVKSNFVAGKSQYFVVEACEYKRSFLNIEPKILVITNIDNDHLDYYKDMADIQSAFREMVAKLGTHDYLICDKNNEFVKDIAAEAKCNVLHYPLFSHIKFSLKIPGLHNIANAQAAFAVSTMLKVPTEQAVESLNNFSGTWRRFEYKGETAQGAIVYDDYGHHPTEIKATLQGAREKFPKERIIVAFQPHLYSRTKLLLEDFAQSFSAADEVVLAPIYAAREQNDGSVSSELLGEKLKAENMFVIVKQNLEEVAEYLKNEARAGNVVITMGAGDIHEVGEKIVQAMR